MFFFLVGEFLFLLLQPFFEEIPLGRCVCNPRWWGRGKKDSVADEQPYSDEQCRNPNEEPSFPGEEGIFDFAMNKFQNLPDHGSPH